MMIENELASMNTDLTNAYKINAMQRDLTVQGMASNIILIQKHISNFPDFMTFSVVLFTSTKLQRWSCTSSSPIANSQQPQPI